MCSPGPTQYIFHTPMRRYSVFVLKVSLNSNQPTNQPVLESTEIMQGMGNSFMPKIINIKCGLTELLRK